MSKLTFRPGFILLNSSSTSGGVQYARRVVEERATNGGAGRRTKQEVTKSIDNVDFVKSLDAQVKRVDYVLRKWGTKMGRDWFVDADGLARVEAEVAEIRAEVERLNAAAEAAGSARQGYVGVMPLAVDFDRPAVAREITRTIHETLAAIHAALRTGDVDKFHALKIRSLNLDLLATGILADALRWALERFTEVRKEIAEAAKAAGEAAKAAGAKPAAVEAATAAGAAAAGAAADLDAIEAAVAHFAPAGTP